MKSSPKSAEMPPSTGSKTPASGKKLVQARLPFKTLGGSEPPFTAANDTSETASATANTLTPITDNRKRKQNTTATKDDGIRAAKLNRCDDIVLETSESMELSNDVPAEIDSSAKVIMSNRKSESKENVCVEKSIIDKTDLTIDDNEIEEFESASCEPKAKQSLEFDEKPPELRKSKRTSQSGLFTIKLSTRKSKKAAKAKKHGKSESDVHSIDDVAAEEDKLPDTDVNIDLTESTSMEEKVDSENDKSSDDEDLDKSTLNDSVASEQCSTPNNHKLTPKQVQRRLESEKKKQEKELARLERERKQQEEKEMRQREKEERELQKKREREEKDEQRKKEKELREKKLHEEKMEKQREKEQKEQQRKVEREEKEEQRKREKEERELQKKREREEKEREKEEERKKREDEKRQKVEAEQNKNRKTVELFAKFFVPKKVDNRPDSNDLGDKMDIDQAQQTFMSFQVKDDMKMAPVIRRTLNREERSIFEELVLSSGSSTQLYLSQLKNNMLAPRKSGRTWMDDEDDKSSNPDDLFIMEEDGENVQVLKDEPKKLYRAKFFKFSENRRPPYYGTWRKKSKTIRARKPLALDTQLDYEVDSDDEWEEEEPGESLHGSDDEKEAESEDEYEIDNEFFVPHGHLSDEELQDEDESEFNNPADLKIKLKLAQNEFDDERKKKTQKLKPRLIGLIWQKMDGSKPDNCSNGVWDLMNKHAMIFNGPTVKVECPNNQTAENSDDENVNSNKPLGVRRLQIGEKEIPDLIRLINFNQNNSKFLVKEFCAHLSKNRQPQREYSGASIKAKIKELAIWRPCPEEGRMFKKQCWYVPPDTRKRYNLNDLTFPNTWTYIIPPRRPVEIASTDGDNKAADFKESDKKSEPQDIFQISDDSNSCTLSETLTPELIKQASSKRTPYNIAKYIRPLTQEEKKKQFEPITLNQRSFADPAAENLTNESPSTSQTAENNGKSARSTKRGASLTTKSSVPKKRANLLMSGPVGQELSPKIRTMLVTQFLSDKSRKRKTIEGMSNEANEVSSTSTAGTSDGAKKAKIDETVIVID